MNPLLRRPVALMLALAFVQVVLGGSGVACLSGTGGHAAMAPGAMATMPGMSGGSAGSAAAHDERASSDSRAPGSDACSLPWAPGGCTTLAPCVPHAMTARTPALPDLCGARAALVAWNDGAPQSATLALDTPPPRA